MILFSICTSSTGLRTLLIIKILLQVICTIIPLVIIYRAFSVSFKSSIDGGESAKKDLSTLFKSFIAGLIIFLIPMIINYTFNSLIGNSNDFVSCINNASLEGVLSAEAKEKQEASDKKKKEAKESQRISKEMQEKRKKEIEEAAKKREEQERLHGKLDFSCTSEKVKAQFSCNSLKIVEKHLYDFNAQTFNSFISSKGGFDKYAHSLGGVYGEYFGKTIEGRSEKDFQRASEYVLGWMYMYGWDYMNGSGRHNKWGGNNYSDDAFYVNGGFQQKYNGNFDDVISGKNGVGMMSSECGDLEIFIYWKMGIPRKHQLTKPTRLKDLKVGDGVYFFDHRVDKTNESNWGIGTHNVVVGEVYNDRIVFYDAGSYYQINRNYKRTVYLPSTYSEEADYAAIKKEFGYEGWGARRWYNFES